MLKRSLRLPEGTCIGRCRADRRARIAGLFTQGAMDHARGRLSWMVVGLVIGASSLAMAQYGAPANGEWPTYGGDLGSTRYSQLDQINGDNFDDLEVMWRFKTVNLGPYPDFNYQATR